MRAVLPWVVIAVLGAALAWLLEPFGMCLVVAIVWIVQAANTPLAWGVLIVVFLSLPFWLAPFLAVAWIFFRAPVLAARRRLI
jgi:hypothetical protein